MEGQGPRSVLCVGGRIPRVNSAECFDAGLLIEWVNSVDDAKPLLRHSYDVLLLDSFGDRVAATDLAKKFKAKAPNTKVVWVCGRPDIVDVAGEVISAATGGEMITSLRRILRDDYLTSKR